MTGGEWRLFYGIAPSAQARDALSRAAKRVAYDRGRLHDESLYHLTLIFLGNLPSRDVPRLQRIAAAVWRDEFTLTLSGRLGTFKGGSVLWAGLDESVPLIALHKRLRRELMANDFPAGEAAYTPHITLGRGMRLIEPLPGVESIPFTAAGVTLYRSVRIDDALRYIPLQ